tara:strand:- start:1589 stop:1732 length:144 start_codon:yes stop_codon:yes gene_type:complete
LNEKSSKYVDESIINIAFTETQETEKTGNGLVITDLVQKCLSELDLS